jgi:hypothetical protein
MWKGFFVSFAKYYFVKTLPYSVLRNRRNEASEWIPVA